MMVREYALGTRYADQVEFEASLADSREFPPATIRVCPWKSTPPRRSGDLAHSLSARSALYVNQARTGLFLIARCLGQGRVWLPAYHCPAMVVPFLAAGCAVSFYPVEKSLAASIEFLAGKVSSEDAILGVRYFGFDTTIREIDALTTQTGALFIEDLAHAAFFDQLRGRLGVTSLHKFLPIRAGGQVIWERIGDLERRLIDAHSSLPSTSCVRLKNRVRRGLALARIIGAEREQRPYFDARAMAKGLSRTTRYVIRHFDQDVACRQRRRNYAWLVSELRGSVYGEPLFPDLSENTVPYVLPFLLNDESRFNVLRRRGIQALRWEEMVNTGCVVSSQYRGKLVQLPIHQDLHEAQLQVIAECLRS